MNLAERPFQVVHNPGKIGEMTMMAMPPHEPVHGPYGALDPWASALSKLGLIEFYGASYIRTGNVDGRIGFNPCLLRRGILIQ